MSLVPCSACKRHVFAREASCPFCGVALEAFAERRAAPAFAPEMSRAERYLVGAAIAATFATASCGGSPTVVETQRGDVVNVDAHETNTQGGGGTLEVAGDPNEVAGGDPSDAERKRQEELERKRQEEIMRSMDRERREWEERMRSRPPCNPICPPYGCVFPDEACDVLHV